MIEFKKEYERKTQLINNYIENDLCIPKSSAKTVYSAMSYSVMSGGKRIRPVLLIAAYELFGNDLNGILPFAAAIEYIHSYSLIHDDLPAMDNDELRRGNPTCHIKFGEAEAILAGDALLTRAFEIMSSSEHPKSREVIKIISSAAGPEGMIGGQIIDIESEGKKISPGLLNELHALKTGALIKASLVAGAVLGNASKTDIEKLSEYGSMTGLAFQIKDDILDMYSDSAALGKSAGSDIKNQKTTYLSYYSRSECEEIISELSNKCIKIAESFGEKGKFLKNMTNFLLNREK